MLTYLAFALRGRLVAELFSSGCAVTVSAELALGRRTAGLADSAVGAGVAAAAGAGAGAEGRVQRQDGGLTTLCLKPFMANYDDLRDGT